MNLPPDAIILESVVRKCNNRFIAYIKFKVPNQGGYDRAPYDEMFRLHDTRYTANIWLRNKLQQVKLP